MMTTPSEFLTESAIVGCKHTLERRNQWNAYGACPICLYASMSMYAEQAKDMSGIIGELISCINIAYKELNEILARDGVPYTHQGIKSSVSEEYFESVVLKMRSILEKAKQI